MNTQYKIKVLKRSLELLELPGITTDKLRQMREEHIRAGIPDEDTQFQYDSILTALEALVQWPGR